MNYLGRYRTGNSVRAVTAESLNGPLYIHRSHSDLPAFFDTTIDLNNGEWTELSQWDSQNLLSPVQPGKIVCVGLNYKDHAAEMGSPLPADPLIFMKSPHSICGPFDPVIRPRNADTLDYEVELAVVIGKHLKYAGETEALKGILGLTLMIDVSERTMQKHRGGQWTKGKSADTFAPAGPFIKRTFNSGETDRPRQLRTELNGQTMQNGTTAEMIFRPSYLVSHISHFMSLHPGDIISTGTPSGVGMGKNPPVYMKPGDVLECTIEGIGSQKHIIEDEADV